MIYECCCEDITFDKWKVLMYGARKCSYKRLISKIKREIPSLYEQLMLDVPNPYAEQCRQTDTHYILVHSMIEYFIRK